MTEKITAADAIRLLDTGKAVAVDVREPDEYAVGHIPGAKLLPHRPPQRRRCAEAGKPWLHRPAGPRRHFKLALRDRGRF